MLVPCGKCINCRINRTREWTTRLLHESLYSDNAYFVTLTYNEDSEPLNDFGNPSVCKDDIQRFFKRLRKAYPDYKIRYFLGSEYGPTTGRPHYHAIIFNLPPDVLNPCKDYVQGMLLEKYIHGHKSYINRKLSDIWNNGFVTIGELTPERVSYCAKYFVNKIECDENQEKNFSLMSRRPGIGFSYSQDIKDKVRYYNLHACLTHNGKYVGLPRYYDKKIFSDDERRLRQSDYVCPHPEMLMHSYDEMVQQRKESLAIYMRKFECPKSKI